MPNYFIDWDTTTANNGAHIIYAVVTDLSNNATQSNSVSVHVDNPRLSVDSLLNNWLDNFSIQLYSENQNIIKLLVDGQTKINRRVGDLINFTWTPYNSNNLLFYRIRRSQTPAGAFNVWIKVVKESTNYSFIIEENKSYLYYISAWEDINGVATESLGSNKVKINITS